MTSISFDRVRPRLGHPDSSTTGPEERLDSEGKAALFSRPENPASLGSVVISCSLCRKQTVRSYLGAARLALPLVHLPLLHEPYPTWMRCPACATRTWVRVDFGI